MGDTTGSRRLPGAVWALGIVSLLMDSSSELVHALLPVFLVVELGATLTAVGLLEGLAEATVLLLKVFSGVASDRSGKRKPLVVLGYAIGAVSKPLFALAPSTAFVFAARLFDRTGKGIRGAPRDALVAELVPLAIRGRAFGMRQSLDTVGAVLGPVLAILLMQWMLGDTRKVLGFATIPAVAAVLVLWLAVREPEKPIAVAGEKKRIRWNEIDSFPAAFWGVVAVGGLFQLARFSEAFLILRAQERGLEASWTPLVLVIANLAYAVTSYPVGHFSDRMGRWRFLLVGMGLLVMSDLVLALADGVVGALVGTALWGLHMGFTQGTLATLIADTCPPDRRGTAFGIFSLASAGALLLASVLAGVLWDRLGPTATFLSGGGFAAASLSGLLLWRVRFGRS
jgi:MFS family permease